MARVKYTLLSDGSTGSKRFSPTFKLGLQIVFIFLVALGAFVVGQKHSNSSQLGTLPLATTSKLFKFNGTFPRRPSKDSNAAWQELFPRQGGFFKHPTLAPQRSAFAVFHQLHCLDAIRQGYWLVHDHAVEGTESSGTKLRDEDIPFMTSPAHIEHCIDLLRNTLMCYPDTTVEVKDPEIGGVTGFGTVHQCLDWEQLKSWTEEWQTFQQDPSHGNQSGHSHNHNHNN